MNKSDSPVSAALDPELQDAAYQLFMKEAVELFQQIEADLHTLSQTPTSEHLRSIIQALHIVNSGATQLELTHFQQAIHRLEVICQALQPPFADAIGQLSQVCQTLKLSLLAHVQRIPPSGDINCAAAQTVLEQLEANSSTHASQLPSSPQLPSSAQLTALALRTEVEEALQQIEMLLTRPSPQANELKPYIEELKNLGEMSDTSELVAISQTALTSLQTSPESALTIGQITLAGYRSAHEQMQVRGSYHSPIPTQVQSTHSSTPLAIRDAFVWQTGATIFVLPSRTMREILIPTLEQIDQIADLWQLHWNNQTILIYALNGFEYESQFPLLSVSISDALPQASPLLIIQHQERILALQVEIERLITVSSLDIQSDSLKIGVPDYYRGSIISERGQRLAVVDVQELLDQKFQV